MGCLLGDKSGREALGACQGVIAAAEVEGSEKLSSSYRPENVDAEFPNICGDFSDVNGDFCSVNGGFPAVGGGRSNVSIRFLNVGGDCAIADDGCLNVNRDFWDVMGD